MNIIRRIFSLMLALCLLFSLPAPVQAAEDTELTRQLINYFRHHQEAAETDIHRLLTELEAISPAKAIQWRAIMNSWLWTETDLDLRSGTLPDNLPDDDSLCIVVLGYKLSASGQMPPELRGRMEVALKAAQQYPNAYILVTGGATSENNKSVTEAGRMAIYLSNNGISDRRIIQETNSYSTEANAINCLSLLKKNYPQVKHLVLITSDYHMQYSYLLFAARQQLTYGGTMDMVGAACYSTGCSSGYGYATQAAALADIAGVHVAGMKSPTLSRISSLTVFGDTVYSQGDPLNLSVTATYNSGIFRDVTEDAEFTGYDPNTLGTQTVIVTYTENGLSTTGGTTVTVQKKESIVSLPSPENPEVDWDAEKRDEAGGLSPWWFLLLIPGAWGIYELHQRQLRKQRRRSRRRRKMNLE